MLMLIFTYHQVMPAFLDFLFPFGRQEYAHDFHFSGFRECTRLTSVDRGLNIPELGRSGREIQMCYNLKSAEPSKSQRDWPWSIRHCALHHSYDIETGRAHWIIIKGNRVIRDRIKIATKDQCPTEGSASQATDHAFCATLQIHMLLCEWSCENWRWYINFIDDEFQAMTGRTLTSIVDTPSSPISEAPLSPHTQHTPLRVDTNLSSAPSEKTLVQSFSPDKKSILPQPEAQSVIDESFEPSAGLSRGMECNQQPEFSFSDLQKIQHLETKSNEILLVLKTNMNVLAEMRQHYHSFTECENWPQNLQTRSKGDVVRFERRIAVMENDHRMQQWRMETLLRLLADRKSLVKANSSYYKGRAADLIAGLRYPRIPKYGS